jgi:ABC-type multidrug transport system ATPase subunit
MSLAISPGITWVTGDEGCGKTTLLRLIAGEVQPTSGKLHWAPGISKDKVAWQDPRTTAFDQGSALDYFALQQARYPNWDAPMLSDLVDALALEVHKTKALYMLSAGTKRKVWLAAAFAANAPLTLLDEPFSALDKASCQLLIELLQEMARHPTKALVVADYSAPPYVTLAQTLHLPGPDQRQ